MKISLLHKNLLDNTQSFLMASVQNITAYHIQSNEPTITKYDQGRYKLNKANIVQSGIRIRVE